jgi:hypothetical protein
MPTTLTPADRKAASSYLADLKSQFRSGGIDAQRGLYREITEVEYAIAHSPDSVVGRIVATEDYQEKAFGTKELKALPSGEPSMGVRITLETVLGDESSRVVLWAGDVSTLRAIAAAVMATGATDLEVGADLTLMYTDDGCTAVYARPVGA